MEDTRIPKQILWNGRRQKREPRATWTGGIEGTKPVTRGLGRQKRLEARNHFRN